MVKWEQGFLLISLLLIESSMGAYTCASDSSCGTCSGEVCTKCASADSYLIVQGKTTAQCSEELVGVTSTCCLSSCPTGTTTDPTTKTCHYCHESCKTCDREEGESKCKSCQDSYYLTLLHPPDIKGFCSQTCDYPYYNDTSSSHSKLCIKGGRRILLD